jgi:hypothetical protein
MPIGDGNRFGSTERVQLGQDRFHVTLHGVLTDVEHLAYLFIAFPRAIDCKT